MKLEQANMDLEMVNSGIGRDYIDDDVFPAYHRLEEGVPKLYTRIAHLEALCHQMLMAMKLAGFSESADIFEEQFRNIPA